MKRAATYAIAALAKRPVMKRRPSAGDLLKLADPQQGSVAAGAGAPVKNATADTPTAAADAAHVNGTAEQANGTEGQQQNGTAATAAARAESTVSSSTLSTDTGVTGAPAAASEVSSSAGPPSPFEKQQHHARSGSAGRGGSHGHARRKSYGEACIKITFTGSKDVGILRCAP